MEHEKFPTITKRVVFYIIIAGFMLCGLVFTTSYISFNRQFRFQYDISIKDIAKAAREFLNPDDFEKYHENPVTDERYAEVRNSLQVLVDKFDLDLIYVSAVKAPEYSHIFYYYDPISRHSRWSPYPLGYEEDYIEPDYNQSTKRVFEEGASIVRHTIKAKTGSHITAQLPVYDSEGRIVAVIGVRKGIQEFVNARRAFVRFVIVTAVILGIFFIIFFAAYFNQRFIKPIILVTNETNRFSSVIGEPSSALLFIKNIDELGMLAHSVYKMESIVTSNIEALTRMTIETAEALASAIDAKDTYTHGHSTRVAEYSRSIARRAGKSEAECKKIFLSALLHDVGKIGIPNHIINKKGKLTKEEFQIIKSHPVIGTQILANITQTPNISDGAHYHHERYDGKGYPVGLVGLDIPDIGRIIAVADAYDAMTSHRSYREALSQEVVRAEIKKGIGKQFDPEYARIMLELIDEDTDYNMREHNLEEL